MVKQSSCERLLGRAVLSHLQNVWLHCNNDQITASHITPVGDRVLCWESMFILTERNTTWRINMSTSLVLCRSYLYNTRYCSGEWLHIEYSDFILPESYWETGHLIEANRTLRERETILFLEIITVIEGFMFHQYGSTI